MTDAEVLIYMELEDNEYQNLEAYDKMKNIEWYKQLKHLYVGDSFGDLSNNIYLE